MGDFFDPSSAFQFTLTLSLRTHHVLDSLTIMLAFRIATYYILFLFKLFHTLHMIELSYNELLYSHQTVRLSSVYSTPFKLPHTLQIAIACLSRIQFLFGDGN